MTEGRFTSPSSCPSHTHGGFGSSQPSFYNPPCHIHYVGFGALWLGSVWLSKARISFSYSFGMALCCGVWLGLAKQGRNHIRKSYSCCTVGLGCVR